MIWTIAGAFELCRTIEVAVAPIGFHVGLRGGVLLNGGSDNDLDIVLYPHDSTSACIQKLYEALRGVGLVQLKTIDAVHRWWRAKGSTDEKHVEIWGQVDRKVDILFIGVRDGANLGIDLIRSNPS